jgi:ATP/maltotriose-dependent transcriptional regulator MalT
VRLWQSDIDAAESAFLRALACRDADEDGRRAQVFAHVNLAYVARQRGRLDAASSSARRATALAEELGEDPLFGIFAELCVETDRLADAGTTRVAATLRRLCDLPSGIERVRDALRLENNRPVRDALVAAGLSESFPAVFESAS